MPKHHFPWGNTEQYHFDLEGIDHPVEFLGIFHGNATAPLFPETPEKCALRLKDEEDIRCRSETEPLSFTALQQI